MANSGVGQFSINVKSNLDAFYGKLTKSQRTMKELTDRKNRLEIDSSQLDKLRDKSQRIAAEMKELRQQKNEIKLGMRNVDDVDKELKNIDRSIASLNAQKLQIDAEIQPIRTTNVELYKIEQEIDRLNGQKVNIDFNAAGDSLIGLGNTIDGISNKVLGLIQTLGTISLAGLTAGVGVLKEAVNAASDLEQNTGGVNKLFGNEVAPEIMNKADNAYKTAGMSKNDYLEQATSYSATLITSLNGDKKKAAAYVDKAITDMSDNSNTFGTDVGLVQHAYEGIMKNNYTMLDNLKLGFKATQEGAIEAVNTYGNLDNKITDISQITAPMMIDAIHNAQEAQNIAGTTAKEAATTYEGSLKMMKGAWKNFLSDGNTEGLEVAIPIYLDNLDKKLKDLTPKIIEGIKKMVKVLPKKLKPVAEDLKKILTESIDSIFGEGTVDNFVEGMEPFTDIIGKVIDKLSDSGDGKKPDFSWVGSVIPDLLKLAVGLKAAGLGLKAAGGISKGLGFLQKLGAFKGLGGFSKSVNEMKTIGINDLKSLGLKMLTIAGISANIYLAAKALQEVQNVGDLGDLQPKMLAIAEAVIGMGAIAAAVGFINEKKPGMLLSGLATIALISADLYLAAKALQQVGEIDSDFGSIQSKIGQIALSITEIGLLAAVVGAAMSTGIGAGVLVAGLLAILGIAGTLYLAAKSLEAISDMELDREKININIKTINEVIGELASLSFDGSIFEALGELINSFIQLGIVSNIINIGNQLISLQEIELDNERIKANVTSIKTVLSDLEGFGFDGDVFEKLGELLNSFMQKGIVSNILKIGEDMINIQDLEIDSDKVETNVKTIKKLIETFTGGSVVDSIQNFISSGLEADSLGSAKALFKELKAIGDILVNIQGLELEEETLNKKINVVKNAITSISSIATDDIVDNLTGMSAALDQIIANLTETFPPEFNELGELLAKRTNEGYKNKLDLQRVLSDKLNNLSTAGADSVGIKLANAINSNLANNLTIGKTISDTINKALSLNYSTKITVDVVTNRTESSSSGSSSSSSSNSSRLPTLSNSTFASGGLIAVKPGNKAVIQDSPEKPLLDNGEYVIPKKIVTALGVPFLEKLRSGAFTSQTFRNLAQSVSNHTSTVINNYNNSNSNNTTNHNTYTHMDQSYKLRGNRRLGFR